jgi:hypothetical protein
MLCGCRQERKKVRRLEDIEETESTGCCEGLKVWGRKGKE